MSNYYENLKSIKMGEDKNGKYVVSAMTNFGVPLTPMELEALSHNKTFMAQYSGKGEVKGDERYLSGGEHWA
jgi:hypothetical protein